MLISLVAPERLDNVRISELYQELGAAGYGVKRKIILPYRAIDLHLNRTIHRPDLTPSGKGRNGALEGDDSRLSLLALLAEYKEYFDYALFPDAVTRRKKLLISDMDSTMINAECIDELADFAGMKEEVASVTRRAMAGELDFTQSLKERVATLKGVPQSAIAICLRDHISDNPGAEILVRTMAYHGALTLLVSGGFTHFAHIIAKRLGFSRYHANELHIAGGELTGKIENGILDAGEKQEILQQALNEAGLTRDVAVAIGDGANDLPMIQYAGLGVAYRAKPIVQNGADAVINHGDLTTLLLFQGIRPDEWAS